jgi:hypothetical protein
MISRSQATRRRANPRSCETSFINLGGTEVAIVFDPDREYIQEFFEKTGATGCRRMSAALLADGGRMRRSYGHADRERALSGRAHATEVLPGPYPIHLRLSACCLPLTVSELASWMGHPEEIDERVKGTEHEHMLTANAAPQRVLGFQGMSQLEHPVREKSGDDCARHT